MNWLIIALLIALIFVFFRIYHLKHRIFLIVFVLIILFFYVTGSRVLNEYDINWKSVSGMEKGVRVYFSWLGGAFNNFRTITANAVKMDWTAKNRTENTVRIIEEKEINKK